MQSHQNDDCHIRFVATSCCHWKLPGVKASTHLIRNFHHNTDCNVTLEELLQEDGDSRALQVCEKATCGFVCERKWYPYLRLQVLYSSAVCMRAYLRLVVVKTHYHCSSPLERSFSCFHKPVSTIATRQCQRIAPSFDYVLRTANVDHACAPALTLCATATPPVLFWKQEQHAVDI